MGGGPVALCAGINWYPRTAGITKLQKLTDLAPFTALEATGNTRWKTESLASLPQNGQMH